MPRFYFLRQNILCRKIWMGWTWVRGRKNLVFTKGFVIFSLFFNKENLTNIYSWKQDTFVEYQDYFWNRNNTRNSRYSRTTDFLHKPKNLYLFCDKRCYFTVIIIIVVVLLLSSLMDRCHYFIIRSCKTAVSSCLAPALPKPPLKFFGDEGRAPKKPKKKYSLIRE